MITTKIYCPKCGGENEEGTKICKECHAFMVEDKEADKTGQQGFVSCTDQTIGLVILSVGALMLIAAVVPFFLLETKDLITLGRMRLIVSLPLGLIAILLIIFGSGIYYGCRRRKIELGKVEENYREKVEKASDAIFTIDSSGRFTYLNEKAVGIAGYEKEDLLGSNFLLVIAPEYREETIKNFGKRPTGDATERYEIEILTKEGKKKRVELSTRTLLHKGEFMGIEGIAREVVKN